MRKELIYPVFYYDNSKTKNYTPYRYYLGEIVFNLPTIQQSEIISNMELMMSCINLCQCCNMEVYIENIDNAVKLTSYPEIYKWTLSDFFISKPYSENIRLTIYTTDINCISKKLTIYNVFEQSIIQVIIKDTINDNTLITSHAYDFSTEAKVFETDWLKCVTLQDCIYYVQNNGESTINATIEYGPTEDAYLTDDYVYSIAPNKVVSIAQPRLAENVRLKFTNTVTGLANLKVWVIGTFLH